MGVGRPRRHFGCISRHCVCSPAVTMPDGIPDHARAILSADRLAAVCSEHLARHERGPSRTRLIGRDEDDGTGDFLRSPHPPASGGDLGPCRAWRSAAFLTALADSSAGRGRDGSPFFYQIWECWVLCDTSDGNRAFLSRSLCRSLMGRGFPNFCTSEPDEPREQNESHPGASRRRRRGLPRDCR